ncbi:helicase associated domain-containing protein [Sinomonas terrae]|uniref:Helicase associated domain-containing protein n=1 Tax=Sinomonas terrae TaxID=2908838 RepID=A0ABS9U510_9MICC|nr:helicase associated domain-containing protein [Sinomonas terrae]MCH6471656.1 helicase associated domain-containing protein [Sinomonas terrae]
MDEFMRRELSRQITDVYDAPQPNDEAFLDTVERLRDFLAAHGRAPESPARDAQEACLGRWLELQKGHARSGTLCGKRLGVLEEILGREWSMDSNRGQWALGSHAGETA